MDTLEDNHEEEFYRFMQDQNKRKKERERLKMLTYEERAQAGEYPEDGNMLAIMPMQDYEDDVIDYSDAVMTQPDGQFNPEQPTHQQKKRMKTEKSDEPEELSIAEQMRRQQLQHWQGQLKTQVGAVSTFKAKIKE